MPKIISIWVKKKSKKLKSQRCLSQKPVPQGFIGALLHDHSDDLGNPIVFSRILMDDDGLLCAQASDQKELAKNLNSNGTHDLSLKDLHDDAGVSTEIFGGRYILN